MMGCTTITQDRPRKCVDLLVESLTTYEHLGQGHLDFCEHDLAIVRPPQVNLHKTQTGYNTRSTF